MSRHHVTIFQFLKPLLHRVEHEGMFLEIPWDYIDSDGVHLTYLFRKDGRLHITRNGEVSDGKWEFLAPLNSLLLSAGETQRLFSPCQVYADAVLVLQQHGVNKSWILLNPLRVPGLDIVDFIQKRQPSLQYADKKTIEGPTKNVEWVKLKNGQYVELESDRIRLHFNSLVGAKAVYKTTGKPLSDGRHLLYDGRTYFKTYQGIIVKSGATRYKPQILPLVLYTLLAALCLTLGLWLLVH